MFVNGSELIIQERNTTENSPIYMSECQNNDSFTPDEFLRLNYCVKQRVRKPVTVI